MRRAVEEEPMSSPKSKPPKQAVLNAGSHFGRDCGKASAESVFAFIISGFLLTHFRDCA